jgi:hypothetical protein
MNEKKLTELEEAIANGLCSFEHGTQFTILIEEVGDWELYTKYDLHATLPKGVDAFYVPYEDLNGFLGHVPYDRDLVSEYLKKNPWKNSKEFYVLFRDIVERAKEIWLSEYPKDWRTQITKEYTVGRILKKIEQLEHPRRTTIMELAGALNISVWDARKLVPYLKKQGYTFAK